MMRNTGPVISFTFDDFPRSSLFTGGLILEQNGICGTYYTSFGLMSQTTPTGRIFDGEDLPHLFDHGHELGCHTFAHCNAAKTPSASFEESIIENRRMLTRLAPGASFASLSYPIDVPRPNTKHRCGRHFRACRAGGQCFNVERIDLNYLSSFFLEQSRDDATRVKNVIDANSRVGGWLIFSTHDVAAMPTHYGVQPNFFEDVVKHAVTSGARILPVSAALDAIGA
jgi:peptidoglycan/xylan/chitin deacetylase (PgdA/CDA1 family)